MSTPAPNWYVCKYPDGKTLGGYGTLTEAQAACINAGPGVYQIQEQLKTTTTVNTISYTVAPPTPVGTGLVVNGVKLIQPDTTEFRPHGLNRCHYDSNSAQGMVNAKTNIVRIFVETNYGESWPNLLSICQKQHVANKQIIMPCMPTVGGSGANTSGSQNPADLAANVAQWVSLAPTWAPMVNDYGILNPANEWGPSNSTVWRDSYISAVQNLRAAKYTCPILCDSGGYGQDPLDILNYGAAVLAADPLKNVCFAYHDYSPPSSLANFPKFAASGLCVIVAEFGPSTPPLVGGPSPTTLTPQQIIDACETNNLGWLAWAWDDNNLGSGMSNNNWFSMTYAGPGVYNVQADLTNYGAIIVPYLQSLAKQSSIYPP